MKRLFKSFLVCIFLVSISINFNPPSLAEPTSPYIRYWLICGPFKDADLNTECIKNEANLSPVAGQKVDGKRWRRFLSCEDKLTFEKDEVFGPYGNSVAYAYCEIYTPTARKVKLYLGSEDGLKVWLNGKNIFTNNAVRSFCFDEDKIDVQLKSGWNRLLIKVSNITKEWCLSARFIRRGDADIKDLTYRPAMLYQLPVKKVEVSSVQPTEPKNKGMYDALNAIDKDRSTRWSSEFSDPQWIILDLGKPKSVKKILLNWEAYAKNYTIEFSNDKKNWTPVYSTDIGDGGQDVINFRRPARVRYIKVTGTKRGMRFGYSLWEVQAFSLEDK
ncbi:MAG TPA: discoidin domain-containing protein [Candidatus Omnitrophica bacterium]|nr:discoidin domain-containing protein [Candidatus Omnitrophota bacterium]